MSMSALGARAGAAAFAVGVGIALGQGCAVAVAAPAESDSDSVQSSSTADGPGHDAMDPGDATGEGAGAAGDDAADADAADDDVADDDAEDVADELENAVDEVAVDEVAVDEDVADDEIVVDEVTVDEPADAELEEGTRDDTAGAEDSGTSEPAPVAVPVAKDSETEDAVGVTALPEADDAIESDDQDAESLQPVLAQTKHAEVFAMNAASNGSEAAALVSEAAVSAAVTQLSLPSAYAADTPVSPLARIVEAMLEFVRRTFFNSAPTVMPARYGQLSDGKVVGTIGAVDSDGDELSYRIVERPAYGGVTINSDGVFVYTPVESAEGTVDTFTVAVRDKGWHVNLLDPFRSTTTVTTVTIDLKHLDGGLTQTTEGFNVWNFTGQDVNYVGLKSSSGNGDVYAPAVDTVFKPGQSAHFELVTYAFDDSYANALWSSDAGEWTTYMYNDIVWSGIRSKCSEASSGVACSPTREDAVRDIFLLNAPGTTVVIPDGSAGQQIDIVELLCANGGHGSCSFTATRQEEALTDGKIVGHKVRNDTPTDQTYAVQISDQVSSSDSLKIAAKEKFSILAKTVEIEISEEYGHTWGSAHTFTETLTLKIPAGYEAQIVAREPLWRVYGDMTITLGNTTWTLSNVYFDTPNPDGVGTYDYIETPIPAGVGDDDEDVPGTTLVILSVTPDDAVANLV